MSHYFRIHSVGDSLVAYLRNCYPEPLRSEHPCEFRLISSGELAEDNDIGTAVTLYLYRVETDPYTRNQTPPAGAGSHPPPLALALHYLVIVWADSALAEHTITAWVMAQLHQHPLLDASMLSASGEWGPGDQIHIVPTELADDALMRLWDVLTPTYRLSLPYVARVIRIAADGTEAGRPVVATRFGYGDIIDGNAAN